MKFRRKLCLACVLAATAAAAASLHAQEVAGHAFGPDPRYQLTLQATPTTLPAEAPVDPAQTLAAASNEWSLAEQPLADAKLPRPKSVDGVEAFSVEDVTAVEYRTGAGIGLGVATNGGWTISQSFVLGRDLDVSVFLIDGADTRGKSPEIRAQELGRTIGLRLNWSF